MSSLIFSDEEAKYVQAMLGWQDAADDTGRRQLDGSAPDARAKTTKNPAVGEFRILVVGAKGTGKTSILTRFATGTFRGEDEPPDTSYERGCRHVVEVDGQVFHIDALEMPSQHLSSNPMLEQALNITEAAMLVYDVRDPDSLQLVRALAEFIREAVGGGVADSSSTSSNGSSNNNSNNNNKNNTSPKHGSSRDYAVMLVGSKCDVDDDERAVSWAQGSKTAAGLRMPGGSACAFMEVSAKTGENVDSAFPLLAKEVLRLKWLRQQRERLEEADRLSKLTSETTTRKNSSSLGGMRRRRLRLWKALTTPFFRR